jgi:cell division protein FtsW
MLPMTLQEVIEMIDRSRPDYLLFLTAAGLMIIGVVMIYSASAILALDRFGSTTFFVKKQIVWGIITLLVILALTRVDYHRLEKLSPFLLLASFLLLLAVLFVPATRGASRWIKLGPITFQPSEFFRYALIFFLAYSLSRRKERIKELRFVLVPYFAILVVALGLIMKQPHLGAVLLVSAVVFAMLFVSGARIRHLSLIVAPVILSMFVLVFFLGYKRARVNDYLSSLEDPLKGSYQMKQSVLALGSGEMVGVGLGEGKAKLFFLPEPHTDFIFATTGEELGFMGSAVILTLFFVLAARGMSIARRASDDFGYLLAFGITFSIFAGFLINAGVVAGLLPTTGLPMPFLSYGGSSLIFTGLGIGILLNVSRQTKYVSSQRILRKTGI